MAHLSKEMLKKALKNMKSLLDEEGKPISLTDTIQLAKRLERISRKNKNDPKTLHL